MNTEPHPICPWCGIKHISHAHARTCISLAQNSWGYYMLRGAEVPPDRMQKFTAMKEYTLHWETR